MIQVLSKITKTSILKRLKTTKVKHFFSLFFINFYVKKKERQRPKIKLIFHCTMPLAVKSKKKKNLIFDLFPESYKFPYFPRNIILNSVYLQNEEQHKLNNTLKP